MNAKNIYDYTKGVQVPSRPFLDDECYGQSIRVNVNLCTDCLIVDREKATVWLPVRDMITATGLWFIGGVWKAQRSITENMTQCFEDETSLIVDEDRFDIIPFVNELGIPPQTKWATGRHDMHYFFAIELTAEERAVVSAKLINNEYDAEKGLQEFSREQLIEANVRSIVIDCFDAIMAK